LRCERRTTATSLASVVRPQLGWDCDSARVKLDHRPATDN
jgi:hypothetical protein